ncbi:MAG TPA: GNAT family N-acetyltransferase [Jatrophihabitans sp.]|nr:GNAT family N-acetyltransferase [Jatrophihabitans sp.]
MTAPELLDRHALLIDGRAVRIRTVQPADRTALLRLNADTSDRSIYLRFFTASRHTADSYVEALTRPPAPDHAALLMELDERPIAVAGFEQVSAEDADIALMVADDFQHEGVGTLLLEQLAALARRRGITRFSAEVLVENVTMTRALRALGYRTRTTVAEGVCMFSLDLRPTEEMLAALDARESVADSASLRSLLMPASVAVVGAGSRDRSVGREVLRNLLQGGFRGELFVVNPNHRHVLGVPAVRSATELPIAVDLAVIAVPAAQVVDAVAACGRRGVRAVLVVSSGFGELGPAGRREQDRLVAVVREHGMRLVGPNCLGLINTDPSVRLNATFAPLEVSAGGLALASQSGALGIAILRSAAGCGLGISQFVSIGNKADVSGNDLLIAWAGDARTKVIGLYLESFGNPRKFARIARRVSAAKPVLAIKAGRSQAGQRAGQSHTAAAAASDVISDALFEQAGVLRVDTMEQMLDAARVLGDLPVPAGSRVVVVGNSGGPGILAADAAVAAGLTVAELTEPVRAAIARLAPGAAATENPIDLGAGMQPIALEGVLATLLHAPEVDAVLGIVTQTLVADNDELELAFVRAATGSDKPIVMVQTGERNRSLPVSEDRALPVFGFPEPAAQALGVACRYGRIRQEPVPATRPADSGRADADPPGTERRAAVRRLVSGWLAEGSADGRSGGWLDAGRAADLLDRYGVRVCRHRLVRSLTEAEAAGELLGYPLAAKVVGVVHKSDIGGVRLGIGDAEQLRSAYRQLAGAAPAGVLLQPMVAGDAEIIVGGMQDPVFGPVVMVGAGGVFADLVADRRFLLAPVGAERAAAAVAELRLARVLDGYRGRPPVSRQALAELVSRVAALVEELPEVAEIDLNPVLGQGENLIAVDAKIRLAPAAVRPDPAVRELAEPASAG